MIDFDLQWRTDDDARLGRLPAVFAIIVGHEARRVVERSPGAGNHPFAEIRAAMADFVAGATIKPVLTFD